MKILVVDDEHSFGSLLGRALKKLGHRAALASHPDDALELFRSESFDAVITDIDLPVMTGVELARRLRAERADIPIAFCTGSAPDDGIVRQAESIGRVLPKVWTVADVKDVVRDLDGARQRLARGSQHELPPRKRAAEPDAPTEPVRDRDSRRRIPRKIKVTCRDWQQVAKLCDEQGSGSRRLTIRGTHAMSPGERLFVSLSLPDELVLSIAAEVRAVETDKKTGQRIFSVEMVGFSPEICARLRSMAQANGIDVGAGPPGSSYKRARRTRGSHPPQHPRDGAVLGNLRLRRQIDDLGKKLKN